MYRQLAGSWESSMRYIFMAIVALTTIAVWLNSPDGQRMKHRMIESRDNSVEMYERE